MFDAVSCERKNKKASPIEESGGKKEARRGGGEGKKKSSDPYRRQFNQDVRPLRSW